MQVCLHIPTYYTQGLAWPHIDEDIDKLEFFYADVKNTN